MFLFSFYVDVTITLNMMLVLVQSSQIALVGGQLFYLPVLWFPRLFIGYKQVALHVLLVFSTGRLLMIL